MQIFSEELFANMQQSSFFRQNPYSIPLPDKGNETKDLRQTSKLPGVDGLHQFVVVGAESKAVLQHRIAFAVGAVQIGVLQEFQAFLIERELFSHQCQIIRAELPYRYAQLRYLQFLVVKRLAFDSLHHHLHLPWCGAWLGWHRLRFVTPVVTPDTRVAVVMAFYSLRMRMGLRMAIRIMLRGGTHSHHAGDKQDK